MLDAVIIGQGLAGTTLALTMLSEGKRIIVMDRFSGKECSRVAAGIVNPAVLKRLSTSWKAREFLPFARSFYNKYEKLFRTDLYTERTLYHIFHDEYGVKEWEDKIESIPYLGEIKKTDSVFKNPFGYGIVLDAGNLNMNEYLDNSRNYFAEKKVLLEEEFDFSIFNPESNCYKDLKSKAFIFCEGWKAMWNPYFSWLPLVPTKGQSVTAKIEVELNESILHKSVFILKSEKNTFRSGATFERNNYALNITHEAKEEISSGIKKILEGEFSIESMDSGIRPTVGDRRPLCGRHPVYENLYIFNGLGSKGVLMVPLLAHQFCDFPNGNSTLFPDADIRRYYDRFPG